MSTVFQAAGIAAVCAVLALTIQKDSAPLSWCLALAGGLAILWLGAGVLREALAEAGNLLAASGLDSGIYLPVVRVVAIGVLVRLTGALCKDAGQNALAAKLELAGTAAAVAACMPLFRQMLQYANTLSAR